MAAAGAKRDATTDSGEVGVNQRPPRPPVLIVGLGFLSVAVSVLLLASESKSSVHLIGYGTGVIVPILLVGLARRIDLDRQRHPDYEAVPTFSKAIVLLVVLALVAAALHVWPLATEWAS